MSMTAFALGLTVIINLITIIGGVVRVSSIIFDIRKNIELIAKDLQIAQERQNAVINEVNHTIRMTEVQIQEIRNKVDFLEKNFEKNTALVRQEFSNELLELQNLIKGNSAAIRQLENFCVKHDFVPREM